MTDSKDYHTIAKNLLASAQNGDAKSQYQLAVLYNDGKGVEKNYAEAAKWYFMAAKQGHQKAQLYLGLLLLNGKGVPKNYKQAAQWFAKSAQQGEQKSQYYLGLLYYKGAGVEKNLDRAAQWLKLSAEQGNLQARKLLDEITKPINLEAENIKSHENTHNIQTVKINDNQQKIPAHTKTKKILATVLGFVSLIAASIGGYYLFMRDSGNTEQIQGNYYAEQLDPGTNDVFKLAAFANPQQLKDAVKRGANFNVERNMLDEPDEWSEEWLFENGETPLHYAASFNRNPESIRFLVSLGLDVNAVASSGTMESGTPLYSAINRGNIEAVKELLKAGANPNAYSSSGNMMQILACGKNNSFSKSTAETLIKYGGNVNEHYETERKRNILKPRSSWTSENPFDNILDDVFDGDIRSFIMSSVPLTLAVIYDNPELVNFFLDENAEPNISNAEGKNALYYAEELPENSRLKNSNAFRRLQSATEKSIRKSITSAEDYESAKYLNDLLALNRVPDYIRNSGKFFCNSEHLKSSSVVTVKGSNVNMRSQPNTQARIITRLNENKPSGFPTYVGEWTAPKGEKWILAKYYDENTKDYTSAWILGKYTDIITGEEYAMISDGSIDNEEFTPQPTQKRADNNAGGNFFAFGSFGAGRQQTQNKPSAANTPPQKKITSHQWMCEFCGSSVKSSNMPQPGNSCSQNPSGKFHSWINADTDGKSHQWKCAFCGRGVSGSIPKPGNSCSKNPFGKKFHKWVMTR